MDKRHLAADVAWRFVGTFYKWGGDDPSGFDCSGLVIEILKSVGLLPRKVDDTAEGLRRRYSDRKVPYPYRGCLVFYNWKKEDRAVHVEFCIDEETTIGASGGGSRTLTMEDAIRDNAFIKVRPIRFEYVIDIIDPFRPAAGPIVNRSDDKK